MKQETRLDKLNELLGITEKVKEVKTRVTGQLVGVTEEEIQEFREAQGILYYLQAPGLFTFKVCPHCKEQFAVSRKFVAYCSYTCIRLSLAEQGIEWRKGRDIEALVADPQVYDGNEPLWVSQNTLERLTEVLTKLSESYKNTELASESSTPEPSKSEPISSTTVLSETEQPSQSPPTVTTPSPTGGKKSSKKSTRKVKFT